MLKRLLKRFKREVTPKEPSPIEKLRAMMENDYQWLHSDPSVKALIERYYPYLTEEGVNYKPLDVVAFRQFTKAGRLTHDDFFTVRVIPVSPNHLKKDQDEPPA